MANRRATQQEQPTTEDGTPVDPRTGEKLTGTFGDEDRTEELDAKYGGDPTATGDIERKGVLTSDQLSDIKDISDVLRIAAELGDGEIQTADEVLGDGFILINDKDRLVGEPMAIADWRFFEGRFGTAVTVLAVTERRMHEIGSGNKVLFNDGSTGIRDQLLTLTEKREKGKSKDQRPPRVLACPRGLRKSEYEYEDVDKQGNTVMVPSKTYYL